MTLKTNIGSLEDYNMGYSNAIKDFELMVKEKYPSHRVYGIIELLIQEFKEKIK
jgi:hypothetical protein